MASIENPALVIDRVLDVRGEACPLPLLKARQALKALEVGQCVQVLATDPGSEKDYNAYARQSGHALLQALQQEDEFHYVLQRSH